MVLNADEGNLAASKLCKLAEHSAGAGTAEVLPGGTEEPVGIRGL